MSLFVGLMCYISSTFYLSDLAGELIDQFTKIYASLSREKPIESIICIIKREIL